MRNQVVPFVVAVALGLVGCAHEPERPRDWCQYLVHRTDAVPSMEIKDRHAGRHLAGDYFITVDRHGMASDVKAVRSIPDCDEFVERYLRRFRFPAGTRDFTMHVQVVFALPAAATPGGTAHFRALPEMELDELISERVAPPAQKGVSGRGYYMVYVEPDGSVSRVDVISSTGNADEVAKETLMRWRFKPAGERLRGPLHLAVELK